MASVTLNQELDSLFLKGLRLLHSSEPDAEEQLKKLWKQAVVDKYGSERTPTSVLHKIIVPAAVKRENQDATSNIAVEAKRPKIESSIPKSSSSSAQQNMDTKGFSSDEDCDKESPLEILNTENVCKKCKASTSSTNNKLVECVDCHKHYHQLCHFPPISDMDLSDPRFVWYCSSCDQNITTASTEKTKASNTSAISTVKTGNFSKGAGTTCKNSRIHSTNNKSLTQGSGSSASNKSFENKLKENGNSNSSSTPEKKGHMMKKRSMKKPDKKNPTF